MLTLDKITWPSLPFTILVLILLFFGYFLHRFFIKPYMGMREYKRQGAVLLFYWKVNPYFRNYRNAVEKGDFFYTYNEAVRKHPEAKLLVENFGSKVLLLPIDPEIAKEILLRYETYQKDKSFFDLTVEVANGTIVFAEEKLWKKKRRILSAAFNFEFLRKAVPTMTETTKEKLEDWKQSGNFSDVYLLDKLGEITGEITGRLFFGKKFGKEKVKGQTMTSLIQELALRSITEKLTLTSFLFGLRFIKMRLLGRHRDFFEKVEAFKARCRDMIAETQSSKTKENNLLSLLLEMRSREQKEEQLSDDDLVGEFIGIFLAGTDTTAHLVNSAIYFLWKYPAVLQRVKEEVDREFKDLNSVTLDKLNRMEYLMAVLKETLRTGGPSAGIFARVAMEDDEIAGIKIKKGTRVDVFHGMFYMMEKYYTKPREFIPERWLPNTPFPNDGYKAEAYSFIPFSAGPRNCIGQHFAMIMARVMIGVFVKTFTFKFPEDYKLRLARKFVYGPVDRILVTVEPKPSNA